MPDKSANPNARVAAPVRRPSRAGQAATELRRRIATGVYKSGQQLPAEPRLADELGVARTTLREALEVLQQQGLVLRRQRAGTLVSGRPVIQHSLESTSGLREMIEASGRVHSSRDAVIRFIPAPADLALALDLDLETPLTILERVRMADGQAVAYTIDYLASDLVERATAPLLPDVSFYGWLAQHCRRPVAYGVARVSAVLATGELAGHLVVGVGEPIFALEQTDYTADAGPVLHSREFYAHSTALEITVVRSGPG